MGAFVGWAERSRALNEEGLKTSMSGPLRLGGRAVERQPADATNCVRDGRARTK